jgi:3D (Asp-Asp-Asp) domain-containing protein
MSSFAFGKNALENNVRRKRSTITANYFLRGQASMVLTRRDSKMSNFLKFALGALLAFLVTSCAEPPTTKPATAASTSGHRLQKVRTTAYTHTEKGGKHNAVGTYLASRSVKSAASDWSRYPLGTRFRIIDTNEVYQIDDYGTALVGTNTIDLYKTSRLEMRRWGVRHVDIDVLAWGSEAESLRVLTPRAKHHQVRQMIVALQKKSMSRSLGVRVD